MHLRKEVEPRTLWIDAVCINQSDPVDKSVQIPLMRDIYGKAQQTIIWLGASTPLADLALQHTPILLQMKQVLDEIKDDRYYNGLAPKDWKRYNLPDPVYEPSRWPFYLAVSQMWLSAWFSRVWIIQEHVLSRQCQVQFGNNQLTWEQFIAIYELFESLNLLDPRISEATRWMISNLQETREAYVKGEKKSLINWLNTEALLTKSTDPRDKIFAMCGIASDVSDGKFVVEIDYQKDTARVYLDFAISYITTYCNTALLEVPSWGYDSGVAGLPSWCPDWSVYVPGLIPLRSPGGEEFYYHYHCAPNSSLALAVGDGGHKLRVNAIKVSEIHAVSPVYGFRDSHGLGNQLMTENALAIARLMTVWVDTCGVNTHPIYVTGEKALDCFAFTITAGIYRKKPLIEGFTVWWGQMKSAHKAAGWMPRKLSYLRAAVGSAAGAYSVRKNKEISSRMGFFTQFLGFCHHRRTARTADRLMALVPGVTEPGDVVMIFEGAKAPFIVRPTEKQGIFKFIGETYVHGIMDGERFDRERLEMIKLV